MPRRISGLLTGISMPLAPMEFATAHAFADIDGSEVCKSKVRVGWHAKNVEPILYDRGYPPAPRNDIDRMGERPKGPLVRSLPDRDQRNGQDAGRSGRGTYHLDKRSRLCWSR